MTTTLEEDYLSSVSNLKPSADESDLYGQHLTTVPHNNNSDIQSEFTANNHGEPSYDNDQYEDDFDEGDGYSDEFHSDEGSVHSGEHPQSIHSRDLAETRTYSRQRSSLGEFHPDANGVDPYGSATRTRQGSTRVSERVASRQEPRTLSSRKPRPHSTDLLLNEDSEQKPERRPTTTYTPSPLLPTENHSNSVSTSEERDLVASVGLSPRSPTPPPVRANQSVFGSKLSLGPRKPTILRNPSRVSKIKRKRAGGSSLSNRSTASRAPSYNDPLLDMADRLQYIDNLSSEIQDVILEIDEIKAENKQLKRDNLLQEHQIKKRECSERDLPQTIRTFAADIKVLHDQMRRQEDKYDKIKRRRHDVERELRRSEREARELKDRAEKEDLEERGRVHAQLNDILSEIEVKDNRISALERHCANLEKSNEYSLALEAKKHRETVKEYNQLQYELSDTRAQIEAKESQLGDFRIQHSRFLHSRSQANCSISGMVQSMSEKRASSQPTSYPVQLAIEPAPGITQQHHQQQQHHQTPKVLASKPASTNTQEESDPIHSEPMKTSSGAEPISGTTPSNDAPALVIRPGTHVIVKPKLTEPQKPVESKMHQQNPIKTKPANQKSDIPKPTNQKSIKSKPTNNPSPTTSKAEILSPSPPTTNRTSTNNIREKLSTNRMKDSDGKKKAELARTNHALRSQYNLRDSLDEEAVQADEPLATFKLHEKTEARTVAKSKPPEFPADPHRFGGSRISLNQSLREQTFAMNKITISHSNELPETSQQLPNAERRSVEASKIIAAAEAERKQGIARNSTTVSRQSAKLETFEWEREGESKLDLILSVDQSEPKPRNSRLSDRKLFKLSDSPDAGLFGDLAKLPANDIPSDTLDFGGYNPSFEPKKTTNTATKPKRDNASIFGCNDSVRSENFKDDSLNRGQDFRKEKNISSHKYPWEVDVSASENKAKVERAPLLLDRNGPSNPVFGTPTDDIEEVVL